MKSFIALLLAALPLLSAAQNPNDVTITQNGKTILLKDGDNELVLKKAGFAIQFFCERYTDEAFNAVKIAAFTDKASLDKVSIGANSEEVPYLGPYTGIAGDQLGYSSIFLNNEGHHYLYYKDEEDRRATLIAEKDGLLNLEWKPHSFYLDEEDKEFADAGITTFYLVIFTDSNKDKKVDRGELKKVSITFK